ncbi:MAG TPA: hypothetical protein PK289_00725 [Bacteroidia bacterium]|jgi:hypothetical protein|nr:hypothetical protein [Bacteroidia bacterium]HRG51672.1 hypothetical protein [Bacteroidia bacterium]
MHQQLKKYGSLFLLLLFLFPFVEKQIHTYQHADDERCISADKHFHSEEHSCSICDYTLTQPCFITDAPPLVILSEQCIYLKQFTESVHTPTAFQDLPSRAPPVC